MTLYTKNKSLLLGLTVIFIAIIISILMAKIRNKPEPSQPTPPPIARVVISEIHLSSNIPMVTTTARVAAKYDIDIVAQVSGVIESTESYFARGTKVSSGEELLKIDDLNYLASVSQARSNVAQAEQNLASEKGLARQSEREWRELGSTEANELFLRIPQIKSAEANLEAAKASLLQAEQDLQRTAVTAPFSGQINTIHANLGQFVTVGTPIARLVSIGHLEIAAPITLNELSSLGLDSVSVDPLDIQREVEIIIPSGFQQSSAPNLTATGTLLRIDNVIDIESQVIYVIVEVKDEKTALKAGQLTNINIPGNPQPNSVWLPESALYERSQVLIIENGILKTSDIQVLDLRDGQILVLGLNTGDQVVIDRPLWSTVGSNVEIESNTKIKTGPTGNNTTENPLGTDEESKG